MGNLQRRADRRLHIGKVCKALDLAPIFVDATDGVAIAAQGGCIDTVRKFQSTRSLVKGNNNISHSCIYRASWHEEGQWREQLMRMALHRLRSTRLTSWGHELWGAVGCSLSHQEVLRRFLADKTSEWCLILEDDASIDMPGLDARLLFSKGMQAIQHCCPNWGLVYLGGSLASFDFGTRNRQVDHDDQLDNILVRGKLMYQTHAYLIRKQTAVFVLDKLEHGLAADAALVSWTRTAPDRCFAFRPRQILFQPGGASRWKDSDIFVEGAKFKRKANKAAKRKGKEYSFAPKFKNDFRNLQSEGVELHWRYTKCAKEGDAGKQTR